MELAQLNYFMVVAKTEHITNSAKLLNIAQPALTKSIKNLEAELGVNLFKRKGRNIELTKYGKFLYDSLKSPLAEIESLPVKIKEMSKTLTKTININLLSASTLITEAIIEFKKTHKNINFKVVQNSELKNADIVIDTLILKENQKIENSFILEEDIFIAVPKNSKYSNLEFVDLKNLKNENFVCLAGNKKFRTICDDMCKKSGFIPNIIFESDNTIAVKNIIQLENSIGFWPRFTWKSPGKELKLLKIADKVAKRKICIKKQNENETINLFYDFLILYLKTILE